LAKLYISKRKKILLKTTKIKKKIIKMENIFKLKNIIQNLTSEIKKQDFLVYFRKMSILEIIDNKIIF
jgi:hypothetical protein